MPKSFRPFLTILLALPGFLQAAPPASTSQNSPQPVGGQHMLFMGVNVAVRHGDDYHDIEDIEGKSLFFESNGKRESLWVDQNITLRLRDQLKITDRKIEVTKFDAERAYSPTRDPFRKMARESTIAADASGLVDIAQANAASAERFATMYPPGSSGPTAAQLAAVQAANNTLDLTRVDATRGTNDVGNIEADLSSNSAKADYDAIRVTFDAKAERSYLRPYLVVVADILPPSAKPDATYQWIYLKSLAPFGAGERRTINVYQTGFPPGYQIKDCRVHLYDHGDELATNLSRRQMTLSNEDYMQYVIVDYISANKGKTLPATPLKLGVSNDVRSHLTNDERDRTYYIRVSKKGRVVGITRDPDGKEPVDDPLVETIFKATWFKPALNGGKPVDSTVPLKMDQFSTT